MENKGIGTRIWCLYKPWRFCSI